MSELLVIGSIPMEAARGSSSRLFVLNPSRHFPPASWECYMVASKGGWTAKALSPMEDYHELRQRFLTVLEAAAWSHESGDLASIEAGYKELDACLPHNTDSRFDKLHVALEFWDGLD